MRIFSHACAAMFDRLEVSHSEPVIFEPLILLTLFRLSTLSSKLCEFVSPRDCNDLRHGEGDTFGNGNRFHFFARRMLKGFSSH